MGGTILCLLVPCNGGIACSPVSLVIKSSESGAPADAGLGASAVLAQSVYGVPHKIILDSAAKAITSWDLVTSCIKSWVFGTVIAVVSLTLLADTVHR